MRLDSTGYYALGIPLYLAGLGVEHLLARRRGLQVFRFGETIGNLSAGLGEVLVGLFLGPVLLVLHDFGYERLALVRWPEGSIVPWVIAFVGGDLCYYVYHRSSHRVAAFWAVHGVHHQAREMNLTVAIRHPWFSDVYAALFYFPMPLLGVPASHFFVAISIISLYAFTAHSRFFHRPGLGIFVTPATHIVHHAHNPRYLDRNFGAMFTVWDRLFGTHAEVDPADPPQLGMRRGYETHDGARSQWVGFHHLIAVARRSPRLIDKISVFLRHPGWAPPGVAPSPSIQARPDEAIPFRIRVHVLSQFAALLAFSVDILWRRDTYALSALIPSALLVLVALATLGGLLDGRPRAPTHEAARLAATALLGGALLSVGGHPAAGGGLLAAVLVGALSLGWAGREPPVDP
jgi:sterol desaturase/sphingolipid hydroxylase (fatty acid hydroxylase superfamily)